jgi:hypothetical protein
MLLVRLEGERISEFWAQPDQLGLLNQLRSDRVPPFAK